MIIYKNYNKYYCLFFFSINCDKSCNTSINNAYKENVWSIQTNHLQIDSTEYHMSHKKEKKKEIINVEDKK